MNSGSATSRPDVNIDGRTGFASKGQLREWNHNQIYKNMQFIKIKMESFRLQLTFHNATFSTIFPDAEPR